MKGRGMNLNILQRIFLVILLGILLIVLGSGIPNDWLCLIGSFLFALALIWGGIFVKDESIPIRVTMLAIAGLIVFGMISSGSISSIIPY